jgi:CheY-like chemotaxis protein
MEVPSELSLSHGTLHAGSYVRITVSDRGEGINPALLDRIFEPFFTTRRKGNGIGLATTREVVLDHRGAMHVESVVGCGTKFEVWLPRAPLGTHAPPAPTAAMSLGQGEIVLVVEEDSVHLLRDEEILAALGYEPIGFTRAADAEVACQAQPRRFDIAVIGYVGPGRAAVSLAASLHRLAPGVPIVIAAASAERFAAEVMADAGISDIVRWPIAASELGPALHECLHRPVR